MSNALHSLITSVELWKAGRLSEARKECMKIVSDEPRFADAWHLLGVVYRGLGEKDAAIEAIQRAIEIASTAEMFLNLGLAFQDAGNRLDSTRCFHQALALNPDSPEANAQIGSSFAADHKWNEALPLFYKAVILRPQDADAHCNLGAALQGLQKLTESLSSYNAALALNPNHQLALYNAGTVLQALRKDEDAIHYYKRCLTLSPDNFKCWYNLGNAFRACGLTDEALQCMQTAVQYNPDYAKALANWGALLFSQARYDESAEQYYKALDVNPHCTDTIEMLSGVCRILGLYGEASELYDRLLVLTPDCPKALTDQGTLRLLKGDFERGWAGYEYRWHVGTLEKPIFSEPTWRGESLSGRSILLYCEQGFGDTFQFIRYAPLLRAQGATVFVQCPPAVSKMLAHCPGIDGLFAVGATLPPFDFQIPLLSVPRVMGTTVTDVPANVPYLYADPELASQWKVRLASVCGVKVAINWQGRTTNGLHKMRDVPLELFHDIASLPNVSLISIQKRQHRQRVDQMQGGLGSIDLGNIDEENGAFMDTAAIMVNCDLVISSDTSTAHLAGGLGVRTWVALPYVADWRWMLERSDSPWYPTMRLFRQQSPGDWSTVFEDMVRQLLKFEGAQRSCG